MPEEDSIKVRDTIHFHIGSGKVIRIENEKGTGKKMYIIKNPGDKIESCIYPEEVTAITPYIPLMQSNSGDIKEIDLHESCYALKDEWRCLVPQDDNPQRKNCPNDPETKLAV